MAEADKNTPTSTPQAGTVISPGSMDPAQNAVPQPPVQQTAAPEQPQINNQVQPTELSTPNYFVEDSEPAFEDPGNAAIAPEDAITWTASEFIAHQKSSGWYMALGVVTLLAAVLIFLITRDFISVAVVVLGGFALGFYAGRQPRELQYSIDGHGLMINGKHYGYEAFRYFSIAPEGAFSSIVFMPHKRFAPLTTIYYAPQDEEAIIGLLSLVLPMEEHKNDPIDHLMNRIRF